MNTLDTWVLRISVQWKAMESLICAHVGRYTPKTESREGSISIVRL